MEPAGRLVEGGRALCRGSVSATGLPITRFESIICGRTRFVGTGRSPGQVANSQYSERMTLTESLDIADAMNREMWETIYRAPFDGSIVTHKTLYLIGLIDLALEHQAAINLLIRQKASRLRHGAGAFGDRGHVHRRMGDRQSLGEGCGEDSARQVRLSRHRNNSE